jgi:hypothetical protein
MHSAGQDALAIAQQIGDARDRWDAIRKVVQAKDDPAD